MAAPDGDESELLKVEDGYKAPEKKTINEIVNMDAEDESLRRYKENLLVPDDPRIFILKSIRICIKNGPTHEINIDRKLFSLLHSYIAFPQIICVLGLDNIQAIEMPEGAQYHVEIDFYVNHEIVAGLRYAQKTSKSVFKAVDKVVLGSYGPRADFYSWRSGDEEVQSGIMFRGSYKVTSVFTDDDKHEHLKFTWEIKIVKADK
ncbi:unnamed protein product [Rodentolepis nana]|uniref:Rho GDP-dissociation inhibitor 1 n=1 Tax=Rodentolepis nana TaxID=102285 RepID=A0A0R3TLW0_RODNA|nr:unnamed protein product [Rodentolepis nana]